MVTDPCELYKDADAAGITVAWFPLAVDQSLAIELADGSFAIGIDPRKADTIAKENVCIGHELGHCSTGSFYNPYAKMDVRKKHENRADKWAIRRLIPVAELDCAVADGYETIPELADYFNVTEAFMRKAVCWYVHGNLASELYF